MSKLFASLLFVVLASTLLSVASVGWAADNGNNTGVIDCTNSSTASACAECCTGPGCGLRITCCPLSGPCTIKGQPSGPGPLNAALKLKFSFGALNVQLQRTVKPDDVEVTLKAKFVKKTFPKGVNAKIQITGPDAEIASLVWPVAFLGQGDNAGTALANAGFNATITGTPVTCQSLLPAQACTDMAVGLAGSIQGGIGVADTDELTRFTDAVNNMGLGLCGIIF